MALANGGVQLNALDQNIAFNTTGSFRGAGGVRVGPLGKRFCKVKNFEDREL